jgi:hypothetical protein
MASWFDEAASVGQSLTARLEGIVHEAERLGDEVVERVVRAWDQLDDLPFVPDAFRIPRTKRQLYAHGAFMGAAPSLLADQRWRRILAFLMPDVYADVTQALADDRDTAALIPKFENNPVMAAFGVWRHASALSEAEAGSVEARQEAWALEHVGIEWDLFIDGDLAEAHAEAPPEARARLVASILDTAVIAHAGAIDTLQENLGCCQHADVRDTPKADLGGVEVRAWLDLFARSLRLARAEELAPVLVAMAREPRITEGEACLLHTFAAPLSTREAVAEFRALTGRADFSVVLDMKSLRSTPALFADLIRALNAEGVHVTAACSFKLEEIEGLGQMQQLIDGVTHPGPREVLFFHFAGDLQRACDAGEIPHGQSMLFNGSSLLSVDGWFSKDPRYDVLDAVVDDLGRYQRRLGLEIGLYVQEGDCDSAAAAMLGELVLKHEETFSLGFAWGGLSEEVALQPGGEPRMGHGGQLTLAFIGQSHEWILPDPG